MMDWALAFISAALAVAAIIGMVYFVAPILTAFIHYG